LFQTAPFNTLSGIQINVTNVARATSHYEKLIGLGQNGRRFKAGGGQMELEEGSAGFGTFTVAVLPFDVARTREKLQALGTRIQEAPRRGTLEFLDPDGFRVEIQAVR
jgi:catechol 2,3-dioxygenase-like lactoylglutathione lyase family enzyme